MAATGLHGGSSPAEIAHVIDGLNFQIHNLAGQLNQLQQQQQAGQVARTKKDLVECKSFDRVPRFGGEESEFGNFEFKLHNFERPEPCFEAF